MKINQENFDPELSDCISNSIKFDLPIYKSELEEYNKLVDNVYEISRKKKISVLELFKKKFGKQKITINYSRRNWIWVFSNEKVIINCLVSNEGISWEYNYQKSNSKFLVSSMWEIVKRIKNEGSL